MDAHTCQELKLSLESSSHPSPCLDSLKVLALGGIGRVFWKLEEELWSGRVSSTEWKRWGGIYRSPSKTSRCCQLMCLSELPTRSRNFRPVQFQTTERGLSETTQDLRRRGRNFRPTYFSLGRGPFVGWSKALPMAVGTFDPYCIFQV